MQNTIRVHPSTCFLAAITSGRPDNTATALGAGGKHRLSFPPQVFGRNGNDMPKQSRVACGYMHSQIFTLSNPEHILMG
jgi:hypothetical protein